VIVSAQTSTVNTAKWSMTLSSALSARKAISLEPMVTVMNVQVKESATSTSNQSPNPAPVKPANTGTAHAAVVIAVTTAHTVAPLDQSTVAPVNLATSSPRTQTPVLTSVPLDSLKLELLKSATVETQRPLSSSSRSSFVKLMIFSGNTKELKTVEELTKLTGQLISGVEPSVRSVKRMTHIPPTTEDCGSMERWST